MIIGVYRDEQEISILEDYCDDLLNASVDDLKKQVEADNTYIFTDVYALDLSIVGISDFLYFMNSRGANVDFVDKSEFDGLDVDDFFNKAATICSKIASNKSTEALAKAKDHGVVGGRPSISEEKIAQMQLLYSRNYTMRRIAQECEVSLGTVYKYCREKISS